MGTWNVDNVDVAHAEYNIGASLDGITTLNVRIMLNSGNADGTFVEADAEAVLDAVLAALATNPDITIFTNTRVYPTYQSYTP